MPDISMCDNEKCPKRKQCYRFCAVPFKQWQAWTHFDLKTYDGGCYLPLKNENVLTPKARL